MALDRLDALEGRIRELVKLVQELRTEVERSVKKP